MQRPLNNKIPDDKVQNAKAKFIQTFTDKETFQEFKEVLMLTKYAHLAQTFFSFLENYSSFVDLFSNDDFQPSLNFDPRFISRNHPVVVKFLNDVAQKPPIKQRTIPDNLVHQLYRFYATFIAIGAPIEVPYISSEIREKVAFHLVALCKKPILSNDIFDPIAEIVIEALFSRCYPKYCTIKGVNMPILKQIQQKHRDWELHSTSDHSETISISSLDSTSSTRRKPKESIWKQMFRKDEIDLKPTRECMIQVIQNPKWYQEFSQFVKDTHCEENLVCLESFMKLESRTRIVDPMPPSFERFLESSASDPEQDKPIPLTLIPLFLFFHRMFVVPDSPFEVNVTHTLRKQIESQIHDMQSITRSVMDPVIDHVLDLLYQNSFLKFVKSRELK